MKLPKKRYLIPGILIAVILGLAAYTYRATYTPYGRLDWAAATSLRLMAFEYDYKPYPDSDYSITLPVNLIYPLSAAVHKPEVAKTEDVIIPSEDFDIPARIYWPKGYEAGGEPLPIIVYYHGGGFVVGSVETFDSMTRDIADATGAIVISVDYRLAPKYPWPAAPDDAYAALVWASEHAEELGGTPDKIAVGGDSAGGNLSAVMSLRARNQDGPKIAAQIMYYPATDISDGPITDSPLIDGYGLSSKSAEGFNEAYIGHLEDKTSPYISPARANSLNNLPPALILAAGFDPLTPSAKKYAEMLEAAGNEVTFIEYPETIHGFMTIALFKEQRKGLKDTAAFLDGVWGQSKATGK